MIFRDDLLIVFSEVISDYNYYIGHKPKGIDLEYILNIFINETMIM